MATEWEYREYVWWWDNGPWLKCSEYTEEAARAYFWEACRDKVTVELEEYAEIGWQPERDDLARGVQVRRYRTLRRGWWGGLALLGAFLLTEGMLLLAGHLLSDWHYTMVSYRLQLRRPQPRRKRAPKPIALIGE